MNPYYKRQISLPEVGEEGQKKLAEASCLVVGAGGLGCPALSYLAAAGIGTIGICDFDRVDLTNLHRQVLYSVDDVGHSKAEIAAQKLQKANPYIEIIPIPERIDVAHCRGYDLILDCTDNFRTKFFLNDCAVLYKTPLIRASIYRFEGQLQCYFPSRGDACLRCLWEEMPQEGCVGSCAEVGVLGPLPGFFGTLQAMEAIKYLLGMENLSSLLLYDLITHDQKKITMPKNPDCPLCGDHPQINSPESDCEVEPSSINLDSFILVDIREECEVQSDPLEGRPYLHLPLSCFGSTSLERDKFYLIFCRSGRRSRDLVLSLRKEGFDKVYSLVGGITSLARISHQPFGRFAHLYPHLSS